MTLGAIPACHERGLELADTRLMRFTDPPFTTVRQPVWQIANDAAALLLAQ